MTSNPTCRKHLLIDELHRLRGMELDMVPLQDKKSLVKFASRRFIPVETLEAMIVSGEATGLGLRLSRLTVMDIDDPDPSWVDRVEARFGPTKVRVRTPSGGIHLYYAGQLRHRPNLKGEGWPVDVKTGSNEYVVCAGSWRTDGGEYRVEGLAIARGALPQIQDSAPATPAHRRKAAKTKPTQATQDGIVDVGQRHDYLIARGKRLVRDAESEADLLDALRRVFAEECDTSRPMEKQELEGIAKWCWDLQQKGQNYLPGESFVAVPRWAMEKVRGNSNAQHLTVVLYQLHGGAPNKTFCLDHRGMRNGGWTDLGTHAFRSAVRALLDAGVILEAVPYVRRQRKTRYQLAPTPPEPLT